MGTASCEGPVCQHSSIRNKKGYFYSDFVVTCSLLLSSVSSSQQLCNVCIYLWQLLTCSGALRVAVRGAGDKELHKEGHRRASGAKTRMTGRHPPPPTLPHWGWGISKSGASKAITVISSPSDHFCQLKITGFQIIHVFILLYFPFMLLSDFLSSTVLTLALPPPLVYFQLHHRHQKTRP